MKFYGREEELRLLDEIRKISENGSQFTMVTGRRRIGKTALITKSIECTRSVYLFVSRVNQPLLCQDMVAAVREAGIEILGNPDKVSDILRALMLHSRSEHITVVIDEFQDLEYVDKTIFNDIQDVWDRYKDDSSISLIVSGSVHSMMSRIFENEKEPLFGRLTSKIILRPLPIKIMEEVLRDHNLEYTSEDMLTFYMLTGGVPLYMENLMDSGAFTSGAMISTAISARSVFLMDGKDILISEFGKDYRTYFSIMQLISSGKERRSEMESVLGMELGPYLKRLDEEYGFIRQISPIFSKPDSRNSRWVITDMYLRFYFRFIRPGSGLIESGRYDLLRRSVEHDLPDFQGRTLENLFRRRISEEDTYTQIGGYWNRKGDVEIDIVVLDEIDRKARLIEVKRNPQKLNMGELRRKGESIAHELEGYDVSYEGLSLQDVRR